jgi:ATP-dependent Zn protease
MKNSPLISLLTFHTPSSSPVPTSCSNRSNSSSSSSFEDFESNGGSNNSSASPNSSPCVPYLRSDTSTGSHVTTSTRDCRNHHDCNEQNNEDWKNLNVYKEILRKICKNVIVGGSKFSWRTSSILLMMLMSYFYHRRKHPKRNQWKSSSIITTSSIATAVGSTMFTIRRALLTYLGSLLLLPNKKQNKQQRTTLQNVSISQFWDAANNGIITKALLNASTCIYRTSSTESRGGGGGEQQQQEHWYRVNLPFQSSTFQTQLLNSLTDGGCKDIGVLPESWMSLVTIPAILSSLPFLYLLLLYKLMQRLQQEQNHQNIHNQGSSSRRSTKEYNTKFRDVAGADTAKIELMEVVECLKSPERYRRIGARPPRGVLLYGPAGTGKTLLARAVAGEANCSCFLSCSASDFVEMLVGRGAARVRALFDTAKKEALRRHEEENAQDRYQFFARGRLYPTTSTNLITRFCSSIPCFLPNNIFNSNLPHTYSNSLSSSLFQAKKPTAIIFIDEIDALAKSRMGGLHGNDEREQTLNQLLTEMDGFEQQQSLSSEVTIIVLAATNRPEILDSALLRPGRFDRHVYVGYPDARGREDILRLHTKHVKLDLYTVDLQRIATSTMAEGFTGADLRNVVNEAAFLALRDGRDSVGQRHLLGAMEKVGAMKRN